MKPLFRVFIGMGYMVLGGYSFGLAQDTVRDSLINAAQSDTLAEVPTPLDSLYAVAIDTAQTRKGFLGQVLFPGPRPPFDPEVAWKRSLLVPGWGQIYNKDYWKLPFVYGGYVAVGVVIHFNNNQYQEFRQAFIERNDDDPENDFDSFPETVPDDGLKRARDLARQQRDLSIIAVAGIHLLQTLEAFVDAHLRGFDVSDDLALELTPDLGAGGPHLLQPGIRLTWTFP